MADVYAIFGTLLALGIAFPGMLTAWWLLFPRTVEGAQQRLSATPWRCFWLGLGVVFLISLPATILLALPFGPAKFAGAVIIFGGLAFGSLGAAGIARLMAGRLAGSSGRSRLQMSAFVRAAVALELAAAFPLIGWFVVIPLTIIVSLGAAAFSVLGWLPRPAVSVTAEPAGSQA